MQTGQRGWVAEGGATPIRCIHARLLDLACGYAVEGNIRPRGLTSLIWYLRHFCPAGAGALTATYWDHNGPVWFSPRGSTRKL